MAAPNIKECNKRFQKVATGGKVYCPNGTAHLVDDSSIIITSDICNQY